jgi:hypothetical protein
MGDWGQATEHQKKVAETQAQYAQKIGKIQCMLTAGDNFYVKMPLGVADPAWRTVFEDMYDAKRLDFPWYVSYGNHDFEFGKAPLELQYSLDHPESRWKFPARWYRLDLMANGLDKPVMSVLMLDSNRQIANDEEWAAQQKFIDDQLTAIPEGTWTMAVCHHPPFTNGDHGDTGPLQTAWGPIMKKHHLDVWLCGHDHDLQHLEIPGWTNTFMLVGGGGGKIRPMLVDNRGPFSRSIYGFAHVTVTPEKLVAHYIGETGEELHTFQRTKAGVVAVLSSTPSDKATTKKLKTIFYLADTAWNGVLLSREADWYEYLDDRAAKGFTAIQFVVMPWAGATANAEAEVAYRHDPTLGYLPNHDFFIRIDQRIAAINARGMLAVPVLAWAANFGESGRLNPGIALPVKALAELIDYQVKRLKDHHVLWILAGDGRYAGLRSFRWKRIGRKVFEPLPNHAPVAMHPMGHHWPYPSFRREGWLDVLGYQTSHSSDDRTLHWMQTGPATVGWDRDRRPRINLEPCYEGIRNWATGGTFTDGDVRRAMYNSLLNTPTAGVSYGAHGIWSWQTEPAEPLNHAGVGVARPWREAMNFPGSHDVQRLAEFCTSVNWWTLRPAPDLLLSQPGKSDPRRFVSISAGDGLIIAYLPQGGTIELDPSRLAGMKSQWFNPRTAERSPAEVVAGRVSAQNDGDWVLLLQR